jgi:electron transfer flavoprotein beta subunit
VQWIINPYDEWYALVRAIELKEAKPDTVLHLATVGGADADPIIRKALALGGDEAYRINLDGADCYQVAFQLAQLISKGGYDLVLTGKETIDYNGSSLGGMIAGINDLPYVSLATHLEIAENKAIVTREIEGGEEVCEVAFPLVVSAQKGMAEARIPNMRGIMVVEPIAQDPLTTVTAFELPAPKAGVKLVAPDQVDELVRLLHQEAKVL